MCIRDRLLEDEKNLSISCYTIGGWHFANSAFMHNEDLEWDSKLFRDHVSVHRKSQNLGFRVVRMSFDDPAMQLGKSFLQKSIPSKNE